MATNLHSSLSLHMLWDILCWVNGHRFCADSTFQCTKVPSGLKWMIQPAPRSYPMPLFWERVGVSLGDVTDHARVPDCPSRECLGTPGFASDEELEVAKTALQCFSSLNSSTELIKLNCYKHPSITTIADRVRLTYVGLHQVLLQNPTTLPKLKLEAMTWMGNMRWLLSTGKFTGATRQARDRSHQLLVAWKPVTETWRIVKFVWLIIQCCLSWLQPQ